MAKKRINISNETIKFDGKSFVVLGRSFDTRLKAEKYLATNSRPEVIVEENKPKEQ